MKLFRKLMCWLGFHKKVVISMDLMVNGEIKPVWYHVCQYCSDGHPLITEERL